MYICVAWERGIDVVVTAKSLRLCFATKSFWVRGLSIRERESGGGGVWTDHMQADLSGRPHGVSRLRAVSSVCARCVNILSHDIARSTWDIAWPSWCRAPKYHDGPCFDSCLFFTGAIETSWQSLYGLHSHLATGFYLFFRCSPSGALATLTTKIGADSRSRRGDEMGASRHKVVEMTIMSWCVACRLFTHPPRYQIRQKDRWAW